ncbi:hypothetical protein V2J09_016968 [Rumex salicifolius]
MNSQASFASLFKVFAGGGVASPLKVTSNSLDHQCVTYPPLLNSSNHQFFLFCCFSAQDQRSDNRIGERRSGSRITPTAISLSEFWSLSLTLPALSSLISSQLVLSGRLVLCSSLIRTRTQIVGLRLTVMGMFIMGISLGGDNKKGGSASNRITRAEPKTGD